MFLTVTSPPLLLLSPVLLLLLAASAVEACVWSEGLLPVLWP